MSLAPELVLDRKWSCSCSSCTILKSELVSFPLFLARWDRFELDPGRYSSGFRGCLVLAAAPRLALIAPRGRATRAHLSPLQSSALPNKGVELRIREQDWWESSNQEVEGDPKA